MRKLLPTLPILFVLSLADVGRADAPADAGAIVKGKEEEEITTIMRSFTKALGKKCNFCHVRKEGKFEYKKWTKRKRIALFMHTHFVQKLKQSDGSAVTCNTCHEGSAKILKRALR